MLSNKTNCGVCYSSTGTHIFVVFVMVLLVLAILFGNCISLAVFLGGKHFRTPQGYLKVSLAVADLALGVLVVPFSVYWELSLLLTNSTFLDWERGTSTGVSWYLCNVVGTVFAGCTLVSIATIFLLTIERSIAILKPLHKDSVITRRRTLMLIPLSWLTCYFLALSPMIFSHGAIVMEYDHCSRMCIYAPVSSTHAGQILLLFPAFDFSLLGGTLIINALSLATIHKCTRRRRMLAGKGHRLPRLSFSDIKATKTIGALTIIFTASFSPIAVFVVGSVIGYQWCTFSFFAFWILASNSCFNVIVYIVCDHHFRDGARKLLLLSPQDTLQSHNSTSQSAERSTPDIRCSEL
ncbi:hypothetical protein NDU88_002451 [Pleurodeles waltl]|uniref:G-protein coupled receptors family 1 profile domain-containing protein n=1 Tax=Pleurodeles waltl TaxID=8319 RepID=A0AAV7UXD3_PLEWA|nr:hypothetical protein NDU88_002451 [Pleurodeles waltl]